MALLIRKKALQPNKNREKNYVYQLMKNFSNLNEKTRKKT